MLAGSWGLLPAPQGPPDQNHLDVVGSVWRRGDKRWWGRGGGSDVKLAAVPWCVAAGVGVSATWKCVN